MPGRASKVLLGAGTIVVLALAVVLVQLTRSATLAAPVGGRPVAPGAPVASAEAPAPAAPVAAVVPVAPASPRPRGAPSAPRPELPPGPVSFERELKRDANGKLVPVIWVGDLREQMNLLAAPMKACIERSGQHPTGKATLHFTVAEKDHKLVIESSGVQDDETLASSPALLECMHKTANLFVLDGRPIPELGTPIYVRRHVRLENGELVEDSIFDFSYSH